MEEDNNSGKDKAEEPETAYPAKTIRFFSSFKEQEEFDAGENAKHTPIEHLQWATNLIERIYADKLKDLVNPYKKINFIEYEYLD
jgi:hypothetical protein